MTLETFKPGDIVTLKSGGPKMVIEHNKNGPQRCVWITADGRPECADYWNSVLEHVK